VALNWPKIYYWKRENSAIFTFKLEIALFALLYGELEADTRANSRANTGANTRANTILAERELAGK
jgi:hypothetical protein